MKNKQVEKVLKKVGNRKQLIEEIKKMNEEINRRYKAFEASEEDDSDFFANQREKFKMLTGTKSEDRIATGNLSRFNLKKLTDIYTTSKRFLYSKWSTTEGREEIYRKRKETLKQHGYDLTDQQYDTFLSLMKNDNVYSILQASLLPSDQIISLTMDDNNKEKILKMADIIADKLDSTKFSKLDPGDVEMLLEVLMNDPDYENNAIYQKVRK